ncbi:hypothetical protein CGL51_10470 [Pyrobaculum aerophilum]|uniref:Uncharacterized protein n=1 Tax=Pyrobaculum aerophilum TaxID=13773 RepID=A0A371QVY4_9CREN|nr:hypothetical protein CGL51_10470 [Pyrobaculum aerophilum]RFA94996.1 hypothetical protein CGL52_13525 [Pyrobaculum aerophilum]
MEEALKCLERHDKNHRDFYERNRSRIKAFIESLGAITDLVCTEDKNFAGLDHRVDLYIRTDKGHMLIEAKLCVTSGATAGKSLLGKIKSTAAKLIQRDPASKPTTFHVFIVVPKEAAPGALNKIRDGISKALDAIIRETETTTRELKWIFTLDFPDIQAQSLNIPLKLNIEETTITIKVYIALI